MAEIRKTVVIKAPVEKVWKAVSTSEGIATWWMQNTFKPELGCEFVLNAGPYGDSPCKVTALKPMTKVGFDWDKDWHLTFELRDLGDNKTEFTLIHSGFDPEKSTAFGQPHSVVREIMDGGWEKIVKEKLPFFVES
ncbi:SRPBCC domain-containing protein [Alicyclobacillus mengziensis]|uniref:SRPBCC domain-containing protein n=1 Tax=Alicyclobacillus mengziensis TaxID=2931921 RepID=A0A9X7W392_9BACL|nr:SRPBCC domain-containing protein [Alicyclobacillus mengziensis]